METTPWYRSTAVIAVLSILFPPLGLVLLWAKPGESALNKIVGSMVIIALGCSYIIVLSKIGVLSGIFITDPNTEAHYEELERHRAEQRASSSEAQPGSTSTDAAGSDNAAAANANTSSAGANTAAPSPGSAAGARSYWTNYRGPDRAGRYDEKAIKTNWSNEGLPLLWRQPVGAGYASFVVAEGRAFTIEQRRRQEVVTAYDIETGREVWTHSWDAEFTETNGDGPRATPTWDEGRIYALGATGELRCLEAKTGKRIWSRNILSENDADNLSWGMAGSPLVVDDKVIVLPGGRKGKSVAAYNKLTGAPLWKSLNDRQAYTSPMLVNLAGKRHILAVTATRAVGVAIEDGSLLWEYPWTTDMGINCSQPVIVDQNRFFISSGYGKGAALVELTASGGRFNTRTVWQNNLMKNKFNSSVLYNGHIYGLDESILSCMNVETGERKWKGGRYGYGQILLAGDHLIVLTDAGDIVLIKATPERHMEMARFSALEGKTWNYPAIAGGRLLVRNANQMACYNLAAE
ncbi:MAG: PQQ-like beta-propeller repeat protein [Blastocatellia bacterium]|nr:PQQ-like beta-propeller repeat protein [Blastocatellia bacterium]